MFDEESGRWIFHQRCVSKSLVSDNQFGEKLLMDRKKRAADILLNKDIQLIPSASGTCDCGVCDFFFLTAWCKLFTAQSNAMARQLFL